MTATRSMSKHTLFVVVALVATALLGFQTGVEAGHGCWTGDDTECDNFCRDVMHQRAGHCR